MWTCTVWRYVYTCTVFSFVGKNCYAFWWTLCLLKGLMRRFYRMYGTTRWSQWSRGSRRGSAAARLLELWVRIPLRAWMSVVWVLYVVRQRTPRRAGCSYRGFLPSVVRVSECDRETSVVRSLWSTSGWAPIGVRVGVGGRTTSVYIMELKLTRVEFLTAMLMEIPMLWYMIPCLIAIFLP
jgi:hypothetical protein